MSLFSIANIVKTVAPTIISKIAPIAAKAVSITSNVVSKAATNISSGISGLVAAASPATKQQIAGNIVKTGVALGGAAIGSTIAGGSTPKAAAIGTAVAYGTGGPVSAAFVGGSALVTSVKNAWSGSKEPAKTSSPQLSAVFTTSPLQQSIAAAKSNVSQVHILPFTPAPAYTKLPTVPTSIGQLPSEEKETYTQPKTALESEMDKIKKDIPTIISEKLEQKIGVGDVTIGDTAKVAAGAAIIGAGVAAVAKIASSKKKSKRKTKATNRKVPVKSASKKRKSRVRTKSTGKKLKFGSPAWRKKYLSGKRTKKKGKSVSVASIKREGLKGSNTIKSGTEAQFKKSGGQDVKYTKNGQPYTIMSNGKARFLKKSSAK